MTATELIIAAALLVLAWTFPKEGFDVKEDELITITWKAGSETSSRTYAKVL